MKFSESLEITDRNPQDNNEKKIKDPIEDEITARLDDHYEENVLMPIREKYVGPKKLKSKPLIFILLKVSLFLHLEFELNTA